MPLEAAWRHRTASQRAGRPQLAFDWLRRRHVRRTALELLVEIRRAVGRKEKPKPRAVTPLLKRRISCLPVCKGRRVVGVVTTTDLIMALQCALQILQKMAAVTHREDRPEIELEGTLHMRLAISNEAESAADSSSAETT